MLRTDLLTFGVTGAVFKIGGEMRQLLAYFDNPASIVLLRLFSIKLDCFLITVCFSNEDNCCQVQGIGKLIKEKLLKGIFKVV